ncbi:hypothetical protein ACFL57_04510 [Candidatus Margulisiibacteriota bacterium]
MMRNIPYHIRQKYIHHGINVLMSIILFFTLFPIGWMIYNSVMSNQDISLGRIKIGRAPHHTILTEKINDQIMLVGTSDGAINFYDLSQKKVIKRKNFKTFATAMETKGNTVYVSAGDKGLYKYDINSGRTKHTMVPWPNYHVEDKWFVNKIAGTIMALDEKEEKLWLTVGYNNYGTIFEIDT